MRRAVEITGEEAAMAEIVIKNVPEDLVEALRRRAEYFNRSLHDEVFAVLREGADNPLVPFVQGTRRVLAALKQEGKIFSLQHWGQA
jgi:plasmid stability protein